MDAIAGGHEKDKSLAIADAEHANGFESATMVLERAAASQLTLTLYSQFVFTTRPDWQRY